MMRDRLRRAPDPGSGSGVSRRVGRWLAFNWVGLLGFGVQLSTLVALTGWLELHYLVATAVAVEAAILHNFVWHERWTWSDRRSRSAMLAVGRLARFNAGTAITSIGGNLLLMWLLVGSFGLHYAVANVLSVTLASLANFILCDLLVFPRAEPPIPAERRSARCENGSPG